MESMNASVAPIAEYPTLTERIQSTFIDLLVVITLMVVCSTIFEHFHNVPDWVTILMFIAVWVAYEPLCTSLGCTVGNFVKRLRVRQEDDTTRRINILQAMLRYAVKLSLGWISFLTINSNPRKRAIHDFAASSVMIKV